MKASPRPRSPTRIPVNAFESAAPRCVSVCPADPAIPATGPATRHVPGCWAGRGLVAQQRQLHGRVLAVRAGLAVRPRMGRQMLARRVEDLDLERAEVGRSLPSAAFARSAGITMPSSSVTTPYRSAFACRHVTTSKRFPGNGSAPHGPRRTGHVTQMSCGNAVSCSVPAPVRQPGVKVLGLHTLGWGTNSLRRTMPTLDSTAPFS